MSWLPDAQAASTYPICSPRCPVSAAHRTRSPAWTATASTHSSAPRCGLRGCVKCVCTHRHRNTCTDPQPDRCGFSAIHTTSMLLTTRLSPSLLRSGGFSLAQKRPLRALAARRHPLRCGSLLRSRRRWRRRKSLCRLRRFALLRSASAFGYVFALTVLSVAPTLVFGLVGICLRYRFCRLRRK